MNASQDTPRFRMKMTDKERISMTDNKNINYEPVIHTDVSDYDERLSLRHMRESICSVDEISFSTEHNYNIRGARYIVRSIFPLHEKPNAADKIKHLLSSAIDNNSLILRKSLDCETDKEYNDVDENISIVTSQSV